LPDVAKTQSEIRKGSLQGLIDNVETVKQSTGNVDVDPITHITKVHASLARKKPEQRKFKIPNGIAQNAILKTHDQLRNDRTNPVRFPSSQLSARNENQEFLAPVRNVTLITPWLNPLLTM
jgi:hypothetical protein